MANSVRVTNSFIDSIFPVFGQKRVDTPIWDSARSMFLVDDYVSKNGYRHYTGIRLSDRFIINIYIGKYYNWDYLDKVEVYVFDGTSSKIIGARPFEKQFYDEGLVKDIVRTTMLNYAKSQQMNAAHKMSDEQLIRQIDGMVDGSYAGVLDNTSYVKLETAVKLLKSSSMR